MLPVDGNEAARGFPGEARRFEGDSITRDGDSAMKATAGNVRVDLLADDDESFTVVLSGPGFRYCGVGSESTVASSASTTSVSDHQEIRHVASLGGRTFAGTWSIHDSVR